MNREHVARSRRSKYSSPLMDSLSLVKEILTFYDKIKPKNPTNSFTVVSSLSDYETGRLLVLASGTQACNRIYEDDIEDCHAESLVKRGLKRYILDNADSILAETHGRDSKFHNNKTSKSRVFLTLFISQFPCGLIKRYEGDEPLDPLTGEIIKRKPGRGKFTQDKGMIYVEKESCLDKIKRWLTYGIQGKRFATDFGSVIFEIKQILIGDCEPDESLDYHHYIEVMKQYLRDNSRTHVLDLQLVSIRREDLVYNCNKKPQPVSLVWWNKPKLSIDSTGLDSDKSSAELIVDGRRRGLTKSQCANQNESLKLKISDSLIRRDINNLLNIKALN